MSLGEIRCFPSSISAMFELKVISGLVGNAHPDVNMLKAEPWVWHLFSLGDVRRFFLPSVASGEVGAHFLFLRILDPWGVVGVSIGCGGWWWLVSSPSPGSGVLAANACSVFSLGGVVKFVFSPISENGLSWLCGV